MKCKIWTCLFLLAFLSPSHAQRIEPENMLKHGQSYKQLSEGLELNFLIATYIQDYYQQHNKCPVDNQSIHLPKPTDINTETIQSIAVNSSCQIMTTFKKTSPVVPDIQGKTIKLTIKNSFNFQMACEFNGDAHYLLNNEQCNKVLDDYYHTFNLDTPSTHYKKLNNDYETNNPNLAIYKKQVDALYSILEGNEYIFDRISKINQKCPSNITELKFPKELIEKNEYLDQILLTKDCELTASFKKKAPVKPELQGKTISFNYTTSPGIYSFTCSSNIDTQYLPDDCLITQKSIEEQAKEALFNLTIIKSDIVEYYQDTEECPKSIKDLRKSINIKTPYLESITLDQCSIIGHFKKETPVRPELFNKTIKLEMIPKDYSFKIRCNINTDKNYLSNVCD